MIRAMNQEHDIIESPVSADEISQLETIEALFFAYRDFVSDPDRILSEYGFGRAHHRVLYFVNRQPGMTVAELLDILQITKQSLARVLRQLIESGYIQQNEGEKDRRKRLLFPTPEGRKLILALSQPQSNRIANAVQGLSEDERHTLVSFLTEMANPRN